MFDKKGSIVIDKKVIAEDELMEVALEAGAEDVRDQESEWEVITEPSSFENVKKAIVDKKWKYIEASVGMIPQNTVKLEEAKAEQMLKLMEKLEDNDDVQNVYSNFDISDEIMERLSQ
jgi:transcriptional/translational regulatory protein YebC/TACO1